MNKIKVLIVDDQPVVRDGIASILSCQSDFDVVGQAKDGVEAIDILKSTKPDVVLLDLVMPKQDGLETIPLIKSIMPETHILILTSFADNDRVYQAIKLGAEGYMLKDATYTQLFQSIRDVAAGQASIYPSIAVKVIREIKNPTELMYTMEPLTPRELDTLRYIANGYSNQEIAEKLVVQGRTVAKYVSSILNKLQLANRTQAALYATKKGINSL